jgi:hypothetical protein
MAFAISFAVAKITALALRKYLFPTSTSQAFFRALL